MAGSAERVLRKGEGAKFVSDAGFEIAGFGIAQGGHVDEPIRERLPRMPRDASDYVGKQIWTVYMGVSAR